MPLSEVFVALQTGVMDGQENPLAQVWGAKLQEVQTYLSLTGHVYTPAYLVTSVEHWKKVSPELRAALAAIARDMQGVVYRTAEQMDAELLLKLEATGMKVNRADTKAFQRAGKSIYEEFSAAVPGAENWIQTTLALGEN